MKIIVFILFTLLVGCASTNPRLAEDVLFRSYQDTGLTTIFLHINDSERMFERNTFKYKGDGVRWDDWFADYPQSRYSSLIASINDQEVGELYFNNALAIQLPPGRYYLDYLPEYKHKLTGLFVGAAFDIQPGVANAVIEVKPFGHLTMHALTEITNELPSSLSKEVEFSEKRVSPISEATLQKLAQAHEKKLKKLPKVMAGAERSRQFWARMDAQQSARMWNAAASGLVSGMNSASRSYTQHQQDLKDIDNIYIETIAPKHNRRHASTSNIHVEYDDGSAERERIRKLDEELADKTEKQRIENEKLAEKNRREHKAKMDAYHEEIRRSEQEAKKGLSDSSQCDEYNKDPNNKVWCY